jgi:hypothetical protein
MDSEEWQSHLRSRDNAHRWGIGNDLGSDHEVKQTLETLQGIAHTGGAFFCVDITQTNCNCHAMTARTRKPLGWAKEKVGRQLIAHEFIGRREMQEALRAFEEHRGIIRAPYGSTKPRINAELKGVNVTK